MRFHRSPVDLDRTARPRSKALGVVAAGAATLAVLTSCSGDDSGPKNAVAADCDSTSKVTIMMGTSDMDVSYSPYALLANQLGYFAEECLDVTVTTTGGQTTTQQALIGDAADIAIQTPDSLIVSAGRERLPIKVFHNLIPRSTYELVTMDGSGIKSDADLSGKTIGVPVVTDSLSAYVAARLADQNKSIDSVQLIATGYGGTSMEALKSGQIDAFVGWPGLWAAYRNSGYDFTVLPEPEWQHDYYGLGLGALDEYIEKNPEIIEGVSRAISKATVYLSGNPDEAIALFWDEFPARGPLPGQDEDEAKAKDRAVLDSTTDMMGIGTLPNDHIWGEQTAEKWEAQVQYNVNAGLIETPLDPNLFFTNEFNAAANDFDRQAVEDQAAGK